jgi:hypothetical protein
MIRFATDARLNRTVNALAWLMGVPILGWFVGKWLLQGDIKSQAMLGLMLACAVLALVILSRWRFGLYLFLIWLVFEDFARKYLGNSIYLFFGKDVLLAVVYVAFFLRRGLRSEKLFRPPFTVALLAFFVWAAMEAFNPRSPSITYGLLGLKLYFYYVPLMFVGYALVRTDFDLRRFLLVDLLVGGVVALLGILQAIFGQQLLNPAVLDENLRDLGDLQRSSPVTHLVFNRPTSVFVSDGRFAGYLIFLFVLGLGAVGYFIHRRAHLARIVYVCFGVVTAAIVLSGVRTAFLFALFSVVVMLPAMYYGQRLQRDQFRRVLRTARRLLLVGVAATACLALFFPEALSSRWAFYSETLRFHGQGAELETRVGSYPFDEFVRVLSMPVALLGRGLGTASLGTQYLMRFLHAPPPGVAVENGWGDLLIEIGVPGFILWTILASAIVMSCWSVTKRLRNTPLYPLGFAITWYALIVLFPRTYVGLTTYEDYIVAAFLWLLIGVLFRLPSLLVPRVAAPPPVQSFSPRSGT